MVYLDCGVQWYLTNCLVAFSYLSALHTSLAQAQSFLLMVTTYNSTALKENGITKDIFIIYNNHQQALAYKKLGKCF